MAYIFDKHLNLTNAELLANFLNGKYIKGKRIHNVRAIDEEYVSGLLNGKEFTICYGYKEACFLSMDQYTLEEQNVMVNIISLVMMGSVDPKEDNDNCYCRPLVSYMLDGTHNVYEWDVKDPETTIRKIMFDYYENQENYSNINILYPNINVESLKNINYYGTKACIDKNIVDEIENYSEFEVFYSIVLAGNYMDELENKVLNVDASLCEELEDATYLFYFLLSQTERFGVPCSKPSKNPFNLTKEQKAWMDWWDSAYEKWAKENPEDHKNWESGNQSKIPNFRPEGSYFQNIENC